MLTTLTYSVIVIDRRCKIKKLILLFSFVIIISLVFTVSCVSKEVQVTETYYETEYKTEYKTETYTETEDVVTKAVEDSDWLQANTTWKTGWLHLFGGEGQSCFYYGYNISTKEHSRSHVQVTFNITPQVNKGLIYVVDLTGSCNEPNLKHGGELFGKLTASEGECHIVSPEVAMSNQWVDELNDLLSTRGRILYKLEVGKDAYDAPITFDSKGIKALAVLVNVTPEIRPPDVRVNWSDDIIEQRTVTKERQVPYQVPVQVEKQRTVTKTEKVPFWEAIFD